MSLLIDLIAILIVCIISDYNYSVLKKQNRLLRENVNELWAKFVYYDNNEIFEKCDQTLKEFNEIMFGSPPLKNKVVIVRSIKDYDFSAYRKDIDSLNEYLKDGWSIVNHDTNEFVHTYILGKPLAWSNEEKEGAKDDER